MIDKEKFVNALEVGIKKMLDSFEKQDEDIRPFIATSIGTLNIILRIAKES